MFLNSIARKPDSDQQPDGYPFDLPIITLLESLEFSSPVTIFVGENGCGKSTLLEAIGHGMGCHSINQGVSAGNSGVELLSAALRFSRTKAPKTRFLFRAEDASNYATQIASQQRELMALEQEYDETLEGYGRTLATGSMQGQRAALSSKYGEVPNARSHGEWFLTILQERIHRPGLYLLDEPETPLSPIHELSLLSLIIDAVADGAQFIIATHSPVLMACPDATLLEFSDTAIAPIAWEDVEHVRLLKSFLADPSSFLRHL